MIIWQMTTITKRLPAIEIEGEKFLLSTLQQLCQVNGITNHVLLDKEDKQKKLEDRGLIYMTELGGAYASKKLRNIMTEAQSENHE